MTKRTAPFALLLAVLFSAATASAQVPPPGPPGPPPGPPPRPAVFVDGPGLDIAFLRAEIPFVEFVADLAAAQVHVVITPTAPPGRGGFRLEFTGSRDSRATSPSV
jgi:hypothetical protein